MVTHAARFQVETPRGHLLPIVGQRRRDCSLSIACQMAHELLDVADYVYRGGAGALAHVDQPRRSGSHEGGGATVGQRPRQARRRA